MAAFYEVWDDSTGNRLGEFGTVAEAEALLESIFHASGPNAVNDLAVLAYSPVGTGEYDVTTALEGADVVARLTAGTTSPPSPSPARG